MLTKNTSVFAEIDEDDSLFNDRETRQDSVNREDWVNLGLDENLYEKILNNRDR